MRWLCVLLSILAQGAFGDVLKIQPPQELVVHRGDELMLECVSDVKFDECLWKLMTPWNGVSVFSHSSTPSALGIRARDKWSKTDCTIFINSVDDRHNGRYRCLYRSEGKRTTVHSNGTEVIVAKKPQNLRFLGQAADGFPLVAPTSEPVTVQCMAEGARPKAEIVWYLGNTQLYVNIQVDDTQDPHTMLWYSVSTLTYQFRKEDIGKSLRCLANHVGYDENEEDLREQALEVDVWFAPYHPGGNNIGILYGFTVGRPGEVLVNFTANPRPAFMSWKVSGVGNIPVSGESLDRRFRSGRLLLKNVTRGMYAIRLGISPVILEDQSRRFELRLENSVGAAVLEFQVDIGPPPSGLTNEAIGGVVTGVIALLAIVVLAVFGCSRRRRRLTARREDKDAGLLDDILPGRGAAAANQPINSTAQK